MKPGDEAGSFGAQRPGLTLAAVKEALRDWQGHMRRGARMPSEDEYVAALGLVPLLPNPPAYLARTLRGFADFCAAQGRLDDALSLFTRVAEIRGKKSEVFWRDYAVLLFRLALKRIAAGQVALANELLRRAAELLRGPADLPEAWAAAWSGYSEIALWFERAGEALPAGLHAEHALTYAAHLGHHQEGLAWLRKLAQTAQNRSGAPGALVWLRRMWSLGREAWPNAAALAVQAAVGLAQTEAVLGRFPGAEAIFSEAEAWVRQSEPEGPALADLQLAWGLALGLEAGHSHLEMAFTLRSRFLGSSHPKTIEARQALTGLGEAAPEVSDETPREWDGGAHFEIRGPEYEISIEGTSSELKRLHRRLARLCHPDGAPDEEAAWRHETMVKVNHAAEIGDIFLLRALLKEVLSKLARGKAVPTGG